MSEDQEWCRGEAYPDDLVPHCFRKSTGASMMSRPSERHVVKGINIGQ